MKIAFLFCDMLRAERLSLVNPGIAAKTPVDAWMEKLGGTVYVNAYTPAPDTARSLACFYTGLYPERSGCRKFFQYARDFLGTDQHIFKAFFEAGYAIHALTTPLGVHKRGEFPRDFPDYASLYYDIKEALKGIQQCNAEHQLCYFALNDYHDIIDREASLRSDRWGQQHLSNVFETVFGAIAPDVFDHIFIFSDHGCRLSSDNGSPLGSIGDQRSKITLFWHRKGDNAVRKQTEIVSIMDMYPTVLELLGKTSGIPLDGASLLKKQSGRYVVIEETSYCPDWWWRYNHLGDPFFCWNPLLTVNGIWGVRTRDYFFVHRLNGDFRLDTEAGFSLMRAHSGGYTAVPSPDLGFLEQFREKIAKHAPAYRECQYLEMQYKAQKEDTGKTTPGLTYTNEAPVERSVPGRKGVWFYIKEKLKTYYTRRFSYARRRKINMKFHILFSRL